MFEPGFELISFRNLCAKFHLKYIVGYSVKKNIVRKHVHICKSNLMMPDKIPIHNGLAKALQPKSSDCEWRPVVPSSGTYVYHYIF